MLNAVVAHAGQPTGPHDLWTAWNADPLLIGGFLLALWVYRRGRTGGRRRRADAWRARCFTAALVALAVALLSPLDTLSGALASAHMVQHLLLVVVAAPLLALSAPSSTLLRGSPLAVRQATGRWGRRLRQHTDVLAVVRHPATAWLLHVATLWFWHAAVPYGAALDNALVHVAEHATFLLTGVLFWHAVIGIRGAARVAKGLGILLIFAMALQGVLLSALLTFARAPWYAGYEATAPLWGLDALADQQLAGVLMWIPAGLVYLAAALSLLARWLQDMERQDILVSELPTLSHGEPDGG